MTAQEIKDRLFISPKGITDRRVQKAQRLAQQMHLQWADVLAVCSHEEIERMEAVLAS